MSDYAIRAEGLSKRYVIGGPRQRYHTLRETLTGAITAPFRQLMNGHQHPPAKDTLWALKDVSFEIRRGEVVGIIGRNGAGKSTLLKILSRITVPTEGRANLRGRVASLLEVGTGFHPELTGRENIFLNGAILGMTRVEVRRRFDEIVAFADIERFIDVPVKQYSSGMYMRLAFAIAAHLETDILLVDEVLAVGDAGFQHRCLAKMEDVAGHGRTVLFVSHNLTAVQSLCKRVIYLSDGQTSGDGKPREQIQGYLSSILRQAKSKQLAAGKSLTIADVVLIPNPVESGNDLRFEFGVLASQPVRLNEAAFVLYALEGPRVGVVDLRPAGFPFAMKAGDCLRIRGAIQSIPLVERQYRVSLWIDSGTFVGEVADVVDLIVSPATAGSRYTPARPEARGWVEFKSECTSRVESEFHLDFASAGERSFFL